ncbi:S1C family serine protease [Amphibacillus sediminis]|uniref:S1C family serine protease n=1 Tax=Amphibacillus sediminis TaxID=360185 RepID=UPI0009F8C3C5|nr:serine protease [Amphibacillus sediminis]
MQPTDSDSKEDRIDQDLYEDIEPEQMEELLVSEDQAKLEMEVNGVETKKKVSFPRWFFWLIVFTLLLNVMALFPLTFSIPAIDFLITSVRLSSNQEVQIYKDAVVVIETDDRKGTGFSISEDGLIVTNHHIVEDEEEVTVAFPDQGLYVGEVIFNDPSVDLALLKVNGAQLPYLELANDVNYQGEEAIMFIGNPLRFNGIVNEGTWNGFIESTQLDTDIMLLQAPVYRGNSGSPVINQDGKVIGVIYATRNDPEMGKVGLAIPVYQIDRFIEKQ